MKIIKLLNLGQQKLLSVSCPEKDNLVCLLFHLLNILSELINNFLISTLQDVVCAVCLVGSNEFSIQSSGQGNDGLKLALKLLDKIGLKNL